jgi:hypothetical protein
MSPQAVLAAAFMPHSGHDWQVWIATCRRVLPPDLTCRIVPFDSLCAASAKASEESAPEIFPKDEKEAPMKYLFAAAMLASAVAGFSGTASAMEGCGPGWARGPYGHCRPMGVVAAPGAVVVAPAVVAPPVVVVRPRVCPYGFRWYAGRCRPI